MPGNFHSTTIEEISQWPRPNYDTPNQRTWLTGYAIFWQILATLFFAGRMFLRIRNRSGPFGIDDAFLAASWAFGLAFTVICCISVPEGIGRDIWDVRPDEYENLLFNAWLAQVLFVCSVVTVKVSVLLFYRRMAQSSYDRVWLYVLWILLFLTAAAWPTFIICYALMCSPLRVYWQYHIFLATGESYTCINGNALTIAAGAVTIASDVWTTVYPWLMLHKFDLGISRRQKMALNIIFSVGLLVSGLAILRTYFLWQMGQEQNLSQIGFNLYLTAVTEVQLGIICTCAPFLRAFFRRYFPDRTVLSRSNGTNTNNSANESRNWRNSRWTVRGSVFHPTKPLAKQDEMEMSDRDGKKGFLVLEDTSGRLVFKHENDHEYPDKI